MKRIAILGSTGSVGVNTLDVVSRFEHRFQVIGLGAGRNVQLLREQALRFRPKIISVADEQLAEELRPEMSRAGVAVSFGEKGLLEVATHPETETVLSAMVGAKGLLPTVAAISAGKDIALANKETLVVAGPIIAEEAAKNKVRLLPVDSEHSAIWQCLQGVKKENVRKLILTASGGPFLRRDFSSFHDITVDEALEHPNWRMGKKITIDSATLMNKGLEMIEAHYLFDEPPDKLQVVIHPQSIVHSMVEFVDGSVLAQMGTADMRIPIQVALSYPDRWENHLPSVELTKVRTLEFFEVDLKKFPCLQLAYQALQLGGSMTAVLNAANEVAVENFLSRKIPFTAIPQIVQTTMEQHEVRFHPSMDDILHADHWARRQAERAVDHFLLHK